MHTFPFALHARVSGREGGGVRQGAVLLFGRWEEEGREGVGLVKQASYVLVPWVLPWVLRWHSPCASIAARSATPVRLTYGELQCQQCVAHSFAWYPGIVLIDYFQ